MSCFAMAWADAVDHHEPLSSLLNRVCQAVTTLSGEVQIPCANQLLGPADIVLRTCAPDKVFPSVWGSASPPHVVGVAAILARLQTEFFDGPSKHGVLLRGTPGSGKTTIAQAYVASHEGPDSSYPGGVIWLAGNTVAAITKRIRHEMRRFSPPASVEEVGPWFQRWLATRRERHLVVVEDLRCGGGGTNGEGDGAIDRVDLWLELFLSAATARFRHMLVTTRTTPPSVPWLDSLKAVVVPPLTLDQAVLVMWRTMKTATACAVT